MRSYNLVEMTHLMSLMVKAVELLGKCTILQTCVRRSDHIEELHM